MSHVPYVLLVNLNTIYKMGYLWSRSILFTCHRCFMCPVCFWSSWIQHTITIPWWENIFYVYFMCHLRFTYCMCFLWHVIRASCPMCFVCHLCFIYFHCFLLHLCFLCHLYFLCHNVLCASCAMCASCVVCYTCILCHTCHECLMCHMCFLCYLCFLC